MIKNVSKNSKSFDFFTEITVSFPISLNEHKVKLGICGIFKKDNGELTPIPTDTSIIWVKNKDKIVESTKKINDFINKWIKNNPSRLTQILIKELGVMLNVGRPAENPSRSRNSIDKS